LLKKQPARKFQSQHRIKKRSDFINLHLKGNKAATSLLAISWLPNSLNHSRLGLVVSTKISKRAVIRNKIKRRLREFFRAEHQNLTGNFDLVFVARTKIKEAETKELHANCRKLLQQERLIQ
jgi:ribonuclease P protein component